MDIKFEPGDMDDVVDVEVLFDCGFICAVAETFKVCEELVWACGTF